MLFIATMIPIDSSIVFPAPARADAEVCRASPMPLLEIANEFFLLFSPKGY
jgi:hypothetical protein